MTGECGKLDGEDRGEASYWLGEVVTFHLRLIGKRVVRWQNEKGKLLLEALSLWGPDPGGTWLR